MCHQQNLNFKTMVYYVMQFNKINYNCERVVYTKNNSPKKLFYKYIKQK